MSAKERRPKSHDATIYRWSAELYNTIFGVSPQAATAAVEADLVLEREPLDTLWVRVFLPPLPHLLLLLLLLLATCLGRRLERDRGRKRGMVGRREKGMGREGGKIGGREGKREIEREGGKCGWRRGRS